MATKKRQTKQAKSVKKTEVPKKKNNKKVEEEVSEDEEQVVEEKTVEEESEEEVVEEESEEEEEEEEEEEDDEENEEEEEEEEEGEEEEEDSSSEEEEDTSSKKRGDFHSDLGHVAAFNTAPIDPAVFSKNPNKHLKALATENMKLLLRDLLSLPSVEDMVSLKKLPQPEFRLPRHKPLPKPKPETRWEKFAREKGIQKRKRDRMIWDEQKEEWAPRWGFKRANDDQNDWLIELGGKDANDADKFKERRDAKKLRVLKNRSQYLRNKAEAEGKQKLIPNVENLNVDGARPGASKRGKRKVDEALKSVQVSTASFGRFDAVMEGEGKRQIGGKRRKFLESQKLDDMDRDKKILSRLLGKHIGGNKSSKEDAAPKKRGKKKGGRK